MSNVHLREMRPQDSPALTALVQDQSEMAGSGMTTYFQIDAYRALLFADHHATVGVVAEAADSGQVVGMATVTFGEALYEGQQRPVAYLANLKVHPDYRRQGIGSQLAAWRVERARAQFGTDGVIWTGLERDNDASRATAAKWCRDFFEPVLVMPVPVHTAPVPPLAGVMVRPIAKEDDLAEIAEKQNTFYQTHNFYEVENAESLAAWLRYTPADAPINAYYVATSPQGEILAGAGVTARHKIVVDKFHNPPPPIQPMLPPDHTIREFIVRNIWYLPGQMNAARQIWETMRWDYRHQGSIFTSGFDPRGPLAAILEPEHPVIRIEVTLAIAGPEPLTQSRFIYAPGRR